MIFFATAQFLLVAVSDFRLTFTGLNQVSRSLGFICLSYQLHLHNTSAGLHLGSSIVPNTFVPVYIYQLPKKYDDVIGKGLYYITIKAGTLCGH